VAYQCLAQLRHLVSSQTAASRQAATGLHAARLTASAHCTCRFQSDQLKKDVDNVVSSVDLKALDGNTINVMLQVIAAALTPLPVHSQSAASGAFVMHLQPAAVHRWCPLLKLMLQARFAAMFCRQIPYTCLFPHFCRASMVTLWMPRASLLST
jgi:hypothetical protein